MNTTIRDYDRNELAVSYISKDQNWENESTTYWFNVGSGVFGIVESGNDKNIVDEDGCPVNTDDAGNVHLKELFNCVTEELRML